MDGEGSLVEGRECGACNACCVIYTIDEPGLRKLQGYRCPHTQPDKRCAIHPARPATCRDFYCGWRRFAWMPDAMRPDASCVVIRPQESVPSPGGKATPGIAITLLTNSALKAPGLAETIIAAIERHLVVQLHVLGPPGWTDAYVRLNEALAGAVADRDTPAIEAVLRQARAAGRRHKFKPIVLPDRDPEAH